MTDATVESSPEPRQRRILTVVFVTLVLDLVGFSIIFPLYPAMLVHYMEPGVADPAMRIVLGAVSFLRELAGGAPGSAVGDAALFGGVLGSLYAGLQFLCTPIAGRLSDQFGRRPVLIVCITGMVAAYGLWFFAAAFWVLVVSRVLGGIMSANIATASAAVADVTSGATRTRGMALVGVAFGVGFVIGPALGGISSLVDLTVLAPPLADWGVNPFSMPAAVALVLTVLNLVLVLAYFEETLPVGKRSVASREDRAVFRALRGNGIAGVARVNWSWFLFQVAFAGTTFALPFHAAQRLNYTPAQITVLLVFMGVVLAAMQGGYVRRMSGRIGPRRMLLHGMMIVVPALAVLGYGANAAYFYGGLLLLAIGAAQVQPCLSALASLYAPAAAQGRALGDFRSLGSLGRVVGPLLVGVAFWRLGAAASFYASAAFLVVPLWIALRLPAPPEEKLSPDTPAPSLL